MSHPIFLRVGTESHIDLSMFVDSVRDFLHILKDVDATVSENQHGSVKWKVDTLEKQDAAVIGVIPYPRKPFIDSSHFVEEQIIENTNLLSSKAERTKYLSDRALERIGKMAHRTETIGPMAIWTPSNGRPKQETAITKDTLRNIVELTGPKYSGFGSIAGSLDEISVHKSNEFRVWDRITQKPVRCMFSHEMEEKVKDFLRRDVVVVGMMQMNNSGAPLSMKVDELMLAKPDPNFLSATNLCGVIKDFTGGVSLKQYLEESADE